MKVLLDENVPKALVRLLAPEIGARTVQQEGWGGRQNGDLLSVASRSFDVLLTTDRGIPHQQNLRQYNIAVVLLEVRSNRARDVAPLVPKIKALIGTLVPGTYIRVSA